MDVDAQHQQNAASNTPKPHEILWFPDGNVVLATDTYLFKVFKGLLSLHSSVFRDMFEFPADGEPGAVNNGVTQESYEGLPLVKLVGDKGEDVAHLLRAVFERHYYHRDDENTPLNVVTALLVLSTKYDFADLRKDVIIQISTHYPLWPQDYDTLDDGFSHMFKEHRRNCHFPLLSAAFTADADVLLPMLYFSASSNVPIEALFPAAARGGLSPECLETLIKGRDALNVKSSQLVADLPEDLTKLAGIPPNGCSEVTPCLSNARYSELSHILGREFHVTQGEFIVTEYLSLAPCATCKSRLVKSIEDKRLEIWAEIPSFFNCMGWDIAHDKLRELTGS